MKKTALNLKALLLASVFTLSMQAASAAPEVQLSGFLSVIGGSVLNGSLQGPWPSNPNTNCPCYVADWANYGVYENKFSMAPESHVGVQAVAKVTDDLSLTGQLVSRGTMPAPQLTWAFASYKIDSSWEVQVGRKRIPLYYYSDFQDIGVSYPWVSPPAELYGWEATNYNGVSLRNKTNVAGAAVSSSIFTGAERVPNDRYMLTSGINQTDVSWNNILGGDIEVNKDWLTVRAVYLQANTLFKDNGNVNPDATQNMKTYGLAVNADFEDLFILTEFGTNNRTNTDATLMGRIVNAPAYSIGAGYRIGDWTPFLNYGQYRESTNDPLYTPVIFSHASMTLRYDLTSSSALKTQVDRYWEPVSGNVYNGDSTVLRVSYDRVF